MITFFSNFITEHQIPFCNAMYRETNGAFRFVATEPIDIDRIMLGFSDRTDEFPYVVRAYDHDSGYKEALRLGNESDVVIIGSAPDEFIVNRLRENKLTFRYCERFFKQGRWRILDPRVLYNRYKCDIRYRNKNLHMLCASAYTATDCRFIFSYPSKTYKWGYFPEVINYDDISKVIELKQPASILWVGRFIGWKHPEDSIMVAERLKKEGYQVDLNIIGSGVMEADLKKMIADRELKGCVHMLGSMPPEDVRGYMEQANIFLVTSDRQEGWGAVLNESMNSACAVVACHEIGSAPYIISHEKNGLIYNRHSKDSLYQNVKRLMDEERLRRNIQFSAYETIKTLWNGDVAAKRLLLLIECIRQGRETELLFGPCSRD